MAESTIIKVKGDLTVTISDNGGSNSYTFAKEPGDLAITVPGRGVNLFLDRGVIGDPPCIRYGDEQPCTGSLTLNLRDVSDATDVTGAEFIFGPSGQVGSTWVSTLGANGEVPVFTIAITIEGTDHGDSADHTITCNYCYITGGLTDGDPVTLALSWTSFDSYPTVT